jgi:hypothetical protein
MNEHQQLLVDILDLLSRLKYRIDKSDYEFHEITTVQKDLLDLLDIIEKVEG